MRPFEPAADARAGRGLAGRGRASLLVPWFLASVLGSAGETTWREGFDGGRLDPGRWKTTTEGDFKERSVDVVDVARRGSGDFRLRLRADTRATRDDTVKYLGVRSVERLRIGAGTRIGVTLDWNDQANGSYLSAAVILTPVATSGNPLRGPDWLKVEYVGVPPGRNARLAVAVCIGGRERTLFTDGWPEANRTGRRIGVQQLRLSFTRSSFDLRENGHQVLQAKLADLGFDAGHLHLQLSSHSNYPSREIFFDDVQVWQEGLTRGSARLPPPWPAPEHPPIPFIRLASGTRARSPRRGSSVSLRACSRAR